MNIPLLILILALLGLAAMAWWARALLDETFGDEDDHDGIE
jgi:hypothetical protein